MMSLVRAMAFFSAMATFFSWEKLAPKRPKNLKSPKYRQVFNLSMAAINALILELIYLGGLFGVAQSVQSQGYGLLTQLAWPYATKFLLALIILDLVIYSQHVLFHRSNFLWRFHRVHHLDDDLDFTTGIRFHPIEMVFSWLIKASVIFVFGIDPYAMVTFEVVLNLGSLFTHANIYLPKKLETLIRALFVTPDMHRIHHSTKSSEHNKNFGFNLAVWDRVFRTYKKSPDQDELTMPLGLSGTINQQRNNNFLSLIKSPFS